MKSNFIATIIIVLVIVLVVIFKKRKSKASSWKGELFKKRIISDEDDENHVYKLIIKTDGGKKVKISVSEEIYNQAKEGERYEKIAGEDIPKKI
jgi:hypothetical protein